jgi:hypothetical protein
MDFAFLFLDFSKMRITGVDERGRRNFPNGSKFKSDRGEIEKKFWAKEEKKKGKMSFLHPIPKFRSKQFRAHIFDLKLC